MKAAIYVGAILIGVGIGTIIFKSTIGKKMDEEEKAMEEEIQRQAEQLVNDAFPKPDYRDWIKDREQPKSGWYTWEKVDFEEWKRSHAK